MPTPPVWTDPSAAYGQVAAPPPGPVVAPPVVPPPVAPSESGRGVLVAGICLLVVLALAGVVLLVLGRSDDDQAAPSGGARPGAEVEGGAAADVAGDGGGASDGPSTGEVSPPSVDPVAPPTVAPSEAAVPPGPISPVSARASATRAAATLRCTGQRIDYLPSRLIDGDENTGWGASAGDGRGQSITIDLGRPHRLTSIGLTPGYTRVGPRFDQDCRAVSAFPFNRFVPEVEYRFDDGTTRRQGFDAVAQMQFIPVDVVTSSVTVTILSTTRPPGADDDTVLSEIAFEGVPA